MILSQDWGYTMFSLIVHPIPNLLPFLRTFTVPGLIRNSVCDHRIFLAHSASFPYKAQIHSSEELGFSSDVPPFPALATPQAISLLFPFVTPFSLASIY